MRLVVLVLAVGLAGCGGAVGPPAQPADPGATYLAIVRPYNACFDGMDAATPTGDYAKIREAAAACVDGAQRFNTDLLALEAQAPKAKTDIDALRRSVAQEVVLFSNIAHATTDVQTGLAVLAERSYSDGGAAALVRSDLGLPALNRTPAPATS